MLVSPDLQTVDDEGHQPAAVCVQVFLLATHRDQQQVLSNKELGNECMGTSLKIGFFNQPSPAVDGFKESTIPS